jgi:CRISPR-associated protein Cas2
MLTIVAYDIADPKRLDKVARTCQDFGVRVQYSIFECHLEPEQFDTLWLALLEIINEKEDRIVAYKLDARCAKLTETAGTMVCSERVVCYLI